MTSLLSSQEINEIVTGFGLGTQGVVAAPPARGEQGRVWRLETSTGTWALKELFQPEPEAAVRPSAEFQEAVTHAGVPAPAVVRTTDGRVLLQLYDRQFRVFSWADMLPADPGLDAGKVGGLLASIHRVVVPAVAGVHPWYTNPVGPAKWRHLFRELTARSNPLAERLLELEDELSGLEELLEMPTSLQQLHLDLWADNVRATATGGLCVIDWDNAGPGDPRQELAVVLVEYCDGSPERARNLYRAYVEGGGPGRISRPEDFSMVVAQLAHILEMQCERWLAAPSAEERARTLAAIDEFVSRPLTRSVIDQLVVAIA